MQIFAASLTAVINIASTAATALINGLIAPGPTTPAPPVLLFAVVGYVQRQLQRTFANQSPTAVADTAATVAGAPIQVAALGNDIDPDLNAGDVLTVVDYTQPTRGITLLKPDGTFVYTPTPGFVGVDQFTYTVSDAASPFNLKAPGAVATSTTTVTITVSARPNSAPTANPDGPFDVAEDTPRTFTAAELLGNDTDPDGDPLTIREVYSDISSNGSAVLNANGTVTFTPAPNYNGPARFLYVAADPTGAFGNPASVIVNVTAVNDAPAAIPDTITAAEDIPRTILAIELLGNDTDPDGTTGLRIDSVTSGTGGTAVLNADGTVTFTPNRDFTGAASFAYTAVDPAGAVSNTASVTVNVTAVNDAPTAVPDTIAAVEDTPRVISAAELLNNDSDPDGDTLTIREVLSDIGGTAVLNADGTVTFTPDPNFNGPARFLYVAADPSGAIDNGPTEVIVNVVAVNDAPTAIPDTIAAVEDTPRVIRAVELLGNDTDPDGTTGLRIDSVTSGTGGTGVLNADGTVTFTPTRDFTGAASFTYTVIDSTGLVSAPATVTVTVIPVDDRPVALPDTIAAVEDTPRTITAVELLDNDTDGDGTVGLRIGSVTSGTGGTAVLNADGTVTFTPNRDFTGAASFTYTAIDSTGLVSAPATATVTVIPVNDAPTAIPDTIAAVEDTPRVISAVVLLNNDTDPDGTAGLRIGSVTSGTGGTAVLNANGTVTFTPNPNFNGPATFTYTATDPTGAVSNTATVTVFVGAVNDAPTAVPDTIAAVEDTPRVIRAVELLGNDTDPDGDTLRIDAVTSGTGGTAVLNADGTVTFTPNPNFTGPATFTYTATDRTGTTGAVSNTATVTVTVTAVDDRPVALPDTITAAEDTPRTILAIELLDNDTDADGDTLTINSVISGTDGTVVLNANGTITFTPTRNFNGPATFTYTATDPTGLVSTPTTVTVTVAAVNDRPVANLDRVDVLAGAPRTISAAELLGNDTDADRDTLTINSVTSGTGGTVRLNPDNTVTFTPRPGFTGVTTFTYTASDPSGAVSNPSTVIVVVTAADSAPVANPDTIAATEDTSRLVGAGELLRNDTDDDGTVGLRIQSVTSGDGGTAVLNANGTITFTPTPDFSGAGSFSYTTVDLTGLVSAPATVTVNVTPVNDRPVALPDTITTTEGIPRTIDAAELLGNDTDGDGTTGLRIRSVTSGVGGTAVLEANGSVTFTPTANFNGAASFSYTAVDPTGLISAPATVIVNVAAPVNRTPTVATTLAVGSVPNSVALSPDGTRLYVAHSASNFVSVIDAATGAPVANLPVQGGSNGVSLSPDGSRLYVSIGGAGGQVSIFDTDTNSILRTVVIGGDPQRVVASSDGSRDYVYVTQRANRSVAVIDIATDTVSIIPGVGRAPVGMAIRRDGTRVYVASRDAVTVLDSANMTSITISDITGAEDVALSPDDSRLYVTVSNTNKLLVVDTATNEVIARTEVGSGPRGVAVSPDGSRVYVSNRGSSTVSIIDTATNTVLAPTLRTGSGPFGVTFSPDGTRAYVANSFGDSVTVIRTGLPPFFPEL